MVQSLIDRFKEFRRNKKVVVELKASTAKSTVTTKSKSPGPSPVIPAGEDETSFIRHNSMIRSEVSKKEKKNKSVINELVKVSYGMRRRDILENASHVNVILDKYPFLREPDYVSF